MMRFVVVGGSLRGRRDKQVGRLRSRIKLRGPYNTVQAASVFIHFRARHSVPRIAKRWQLADQRLYNRYCRFYSRYLIKIGAKRERI
jgi:hypothetical protein